MVTLEEVDDGVLEEAAIEQVVGGLKGGKAVGPSGMRAEYLKGWLWEASREKNPVSRRWRLSVRLIQRTFKDGVVPKEVEWVTMDFPQKEGGSIGV